MHWVSEMTFIFASLRILKIDLSPPLSLCLLFAAIRWKDLFPEVVKLLNEKAKITANGVTMTGVEYRSSTVRVILGMKWPQSSLPGIASMFRSVCDKLVSISISNYNLRFSLSTEK